MPSQKIESGHQDVVHDVAVDYYGKRLATASSDATIKIIGISSPSSTSSSQQHHLATLTGHQGPVWQVSWAHPKFGSLLASCSYDSRVIIWKEGTAANQNEWTQTHVFTDHKSSVNSISWAPHELGLCLACGSSDGNISVFTAHPDGSGWETTRIDQAHPVGVTSVSWAPATAPGVLVAAGSGLLEPVQKLVSGGCDNTVKVWKLHNGSWKMDCFPALQKHGDWVRDVAWAPNLGLPKSTIASASQDGTVVIWTVGKEGDQWEGRVLKDFKTPVWFPCSLHSYTKNDLLANSRLLNSIVNPTLAFSFNHQTVLRASSGPSLARRIMNSAISGSAENASTVMPGDITTLLERVEVLDLTGKAIPITDLWKDRKAVVAFARHFGCVLCRKRAEFLASKKERMDASGVALVLIGPGNVDQAKAFSEKTNFKGEIYADPNHSSYDALEFVSGISTTFTPSAGLKIIQSYLEGYRQDWGLSLQRHTVSKGGWQQGGIIVAGPGKGNFTYIHKDKEAGDDPDIEDIIKACCP